MRIETCSPVRAGVTLAFFFLLVPGVPGRASADGAPPPGVVEVKAPAPLEISGVAAVPGGYAVVGDDTEAFGRIWPGGGSWTLAPKVAGPESVDVGFGPNGEEIWLVLGEDRRTLVDLAGGSHRFSKKYEEVCERGLEGLAVRRSDCGWQVAVLWEGGFFGWEGGDEGEECSEEEEFARPRVAILDWQPGVGSSGPQAEFDLEVPVPSADERFRAPDLAWHGDSLIVLLGSTGKAGETTFSHTWLQEFDLQGSPKGEPLELEEVWGDYRKGKNWEALDWTLDGLRLVMGYDTKKSGHVLSVFPYPGSARAPRLTPPPTSPGTPPAPRAAGTCS